MSKRSSTQPITLGGVILVILLLCVSYVFNNFFNEPTATVTPTELASGQVTAAPGQATQPAPVQTTGGSLPSWVKVYFTDPNPPDQVDNGIDRFVTPAINAAASTIDLTSFDLNLPSVVDALIAAARRGVKVRVVVDEVNGTQLLKATDSPTGKDYDALKLLKAAKIKVIDGGRSNGLMHNKMILIDGKLLFMGSWNMSYNDTFRNNNNLLQISEPRLIANYQAKFNELYGDQLFGTHAMVGAGEPAFKISGVAVENYFSPVDHVMDKLVSYVNGAKKSVHFMIFTYTHKDLAAAMLERAHAGVDVQGVIETRGASQGVFPSLFCAKLPVKEDGNKYTMHHKVIIIDGNTVITGSFNFTATADEANDDNLLVIHNTALAALYEKEYQKIYAQGVTPAKSDVDCSGVK